MKLIEFFKRILNRLHNPKAPETSETLTDEALHRLADTLCSLYEASEATRYSMQSFSKACRQALQRSGSDEVKHIVPKSIGNPYPFTPTVQKNLPYQRRKFYSTKGR